MTRGRWVGVAGILLVVALLVVALFEVAWPRYRPALESGEAYALDVSNHQGTIRWPAVAEDGISAVYIKATEGATYTDPEFVTNWREAREAGLAVGAYHFFTLCRPGADQAANLLARLSEVGATQDTQSLPVALDLELGGNCANRPARAAVQAEIDAFVTAVESATGRQVVYYLLGPFAKAYPPLTDRPRWVRRLGLRPGGQWVYWQAHNAARVAGVDGPVDLNVVRASDD